MAPKPRESVESMLVLLIESPPTLRFEDTDMNPIPAPPLGIPSWYV
jgi:hypothetical protein